jgi:hypothetical protein
MSKKKRTVEIDFANGRHAVEANSMIVVLKKDTVYVAKSQEHWPHSGPTAVFDHAYKLEALSLGDGATAVTAGTWAAHVALGKASGLAALLEGGGIRAYQSIEEAYARIAPGELLGIINRTSHGQVLRRWQELEQSARRPRAAFVEALAERVRLFGANAPVDYGSFATLEPLEPVRAVG